MGETNVPSYSISFRLRRSTTEFAFVSVPVTGDVMIGQQQDGTGRLDTSKLVERAIEMGHADDVIWQQEDQRIEPHPIQTPPSAR